MLRQLATLIQMFFGARPVNTAGVPSKPARAMPARLRLYIAGIGAAFLFALFTALVTISPEVTAHTVGTASGLALLIAMARAYPVRLAPKRKMSVDTAPALAAVLLLSPVLAMLAAAIGMLSGEIRARGRWFQALFNSAVSGLRVGAGALAYRAVAGMSMGGAEQRDIDPIALVFGALALYLVSSALVDTAAGLTLGQNPFRGWWESQRRKLPHEGVLLLLGVFAAMPARDYPWLLPVLVVPAAIVRRSLQDGLQLKSEARETLESLAEAMDLRHHRSADHSHRVSELSRAISRRMDLSARDIELVTDAARLRDIGEVALAPDLLVKLELLTEEQRAELREHSAIGARMVERFPDFADCAHLILHHHERWDGWGTPDGLTGQAIPLGARIIAVAETYEALIASRPYREALSPAQARDELRASAGTQLDPTVVDVLLDMLGHQTGSPSRAAVQFSPNTAVAGGGL
jgi:hypothetical protein